MAKECKDCKIMMRWIAGQPAGVNIYQCDKCKRVEGEPSLQCLFG